MSAPHIPGLSIIAQTGPIFIGTILNYLLTGVLIHQLYDYNKNYPNDKVAVKWLVYGVCTLDMLQTGFTTQFSWYYCIQNWGDITVFTGTGFAWTASILPIMAGLIAMIVQYFYAWRIWCLGGSYLKMVSVAIALVAFIECLCAFIGSIKYDIIASSVITSATVPYFAIWLSGSFTCDVLIAGCMTIIFLKAKSHSGFDKTNSIINVLIRHVVETAAITAFCAGVELVLFVKTRNESLAHTAPAFVLGKLYTNCLLANLNNRRNLSTVVSSEGTGGMNGLSSFQLRKFRGASSSVRKSSTIVDLSSAVRVDEERHVQSDMESSVGIAHGLDNKQLDRERNYIKDDASDAAFGYDLKTDTMTNTNTFR